MIAARLGGLLSARPRARRFVGADGRVADETPDPAYEPIDIGDARVLQAGAVSDAACFRDHGFVLLEHETAVRRWRASDAEAGEIDRLYRPEIERIVRERLFPGQRIEIDQCLSPLCRGGDAEVRYATEMHQDFGLTADDFARSFAVAAGEDQGRAWRERYDRDDVVGCVAISFWRTIGMREPLRHMPIALCDPGSVAIADVIADAAIVGGGSYHIALRHDPAQRWYYYPAMRPDELLAFKLFECRKHDPLPGRLRSVFHGAFDDPATSSDAERRQSCEHRVVVTLLAD